MKYVLNNLLKCFFAVSFVFAAVSCGNDGPKEIVIKNKDGEKITSYQEACSMGDFELAHRFLAKMPLSGYSGYDVDKAKEYVFREEALFLMAQGDETSKKRIIFLLKQDQSHANDHISTILELAIAQDDEDFVRTLIQHFNSRPDWSTLRTIVDYFCIGKEDKNIDYVLSLLNKYDRLSVLLEFAKDNNREDLVSTLAPMCLKSSLDRLMQSDVSVMSTGRYDYFDASGESLDNRVSNNQKRITNYNSECIDLLQQAIGLKQKKIAEDVIYIMKPNPYYEYVEKKYIVRHSNDDIKRAKQIYNDAVRRGAFNR